MFVGLKNKIREETGSDVSTVVRKAGNVRNVITKHQSQVRKKNFDIIIASFSFLIGFIDTFFFFLDGFGEQRRRFDGIVGRI